MSAPRLWAADPHVYGPGKTHLVDDEAPEKTVCGKILAACPGREIKVGTATCRVCLNAVHVRAERARRSLEWAAEDEIRRCETDALTREWWEQYTRDLDSPEWRQTRAMVIRRAQGRCEACGHAAATQGHHTTYRHVFAEPLFELVAICRACHDRLTARDRQARAHPGDTGRLEARG